MEERLALTRRAVEEHFWFRGFRAYILPIIEEAAAGRTGLTLLDCGSGTGDNLRLFARHGRVLGVDLSFGGVVHARSDGFDTMQADVSRLPLLDASVDIVTSFDVLQSVPDDQAAVNEMARVLRPGGTAVLTMAANEWLRGDHSEVWEELRRYMPASGRRLAERAGLLPQRVSFMFGTVFPMIAAVRLAQRITRPYREHRPDSDIRVPPAPLNQLLSGLVTAEAALAPRLALPVGSSLLVVARKPG